jgi:hypothetical protein
MQAARKTFKKKKKGSEGTVTFDLIESRIAAKADEKITDSQGGTYNQSTALVTPFVLPPSI